MKGVPVLFLIFNRPDLTQQVFEKIRQARPMQLFIAADGPRPGVPEDEKLGTRARQVIKQVDWECEAHTLFRETNLGCKRAVSSAIDWFFEHVEAGIILEDDCLPHLSFFRFCEELLQRYRDDERIMVISGNNFQFGRKRWEYSYYFSRYNHIWGWATWRRAWKYFDLEMKLWPIARDGSWLEDILGNREAVKYWQKVFDASFRGKIDTWDYPWTFACWVNNGLTILPKVNLVSNIGFGSQATHTASNSIFANIPTDAMDFPLRHPPIIIRDARADAITQIQNFPSPNKGFRLWHRLVKIYGRLLFTKGAKL